MFRAPVVTLHFLFFFSFPVLAFTFIVRGFPQICGDPWFSIHILKWGAKKTAENFEHQGELTMWVSLYGHPPVALCNPHFCIFRSLQKVSSSMCLQDAVLAIHGLGAKPAKSREALSPRHVSFLSVHCANLQYLAVFNLVGHPHGCLLCLYPETCVFSHLVLLRAWGQAVVWLCDHGEEVGVTDTRQ